MLFLLFLLFRGLEPHGASTPFQISSFTNGIPEKAKFFLTDRQIKLSQKLVLKHPIIYEEERCQDCSKFSKTVGKYNKDIKGLATDSDDYSDDAEYRSVARCKIKDKINDISSKYSTHKAQHNILTIDVIEAIDKTFSSIKNN